jgi:hypothetical protein
MNGQPLTPYVGNAAISPSFYEDLAAIQAIRQSADASPIRDEAIFAILKLIARKAQLQVEQIDKVLFQSEVAKRSQT